MSFQDVYRLILGNKFIYLVWVFHIL